jgi:serine phosphatase RsbU (regulator of sigma subunit)
VARRIQESILPKQTPAIPGWQINALWQPARQVSGDFYDFIALGGQRLGVVVGDVTDKGMPAALVMAVTRSVLRFAALSQAAHDQLSPGEVLYEVNNILQPDMPQYMFVTCLYIVLDLADGRLSFANAGHNLPYLCNGSQVVELRATGLPLGLLPGAFYEVKEGQINLQERLVMYSDGLVEAHNPVGEMFGNPRLRQYLSETALLSNLDDDHSVARLILERLGDFTGAGWEQEDDITFLTLDRLGELPGG